MAFCRRVPARWIVTAHCFCALFFVFLLRLSFSVSIVCMVKTPALNETVDAIPVDGNGTYNSSYQTLTPGGRTAGQCGQLQSESLSAGQEGEFEWSKGTQADLLAAISYGYIATQILGGWLARRYGTRRVLGYSMIGMNLCCLLTPVAARWRVSCLFAVRVIGGLFMGVSLPAVYNITARWVPPLERSFLMAVSNSGYSIGNTVAFAVSGVLCEVGFDGGWPSIFYIFGTMSSLWLITWFLQVYDTPAQHPRITAEERSYIENRLESDNRSEKDFPTPWLPILTSLPFWGNFCCFFADDWVNYTLQLGQVVYMKEVLNYDITQNGMLTAVPTLGTFFMSFLVGYLADLTRKRKWLSTINTRRLFQLVSFLPMGICLIATGFVTCENRVWAVVLLTTGRVFYTFCKGGFTVNAMDFAPRYCGEIVGILNSLGTIPGFLSPMAIAILTPNGTQQEWQNVFYLAGGISIFGALGFCVLARGEVQKWAMETEVVNVDVTENMMAEELCDEKFPESHNELDVTDKR